MEIKEKMRKVATNLILVAIILGCTISIFSLFVPFEYRNPVYMSAVISSLSTFLISFIIGIKYDL